MLKKNVLGKVLVAVVVLIILTLTGALLFHLVFNYIIMHINAVAISDRMNYQNDFPTWLAMAFVPLLLVCIFYYAVVSLWKKTFHFLTAKIILCVLLGILAVILPQLFIFGFSFKHTSDNIWLTVIVLLSAAIPYLDKRISSLF